MQDSNCRSEYRCRQPHKARGGQSCFFAAAWRTVFPKNSDNRSLAQTTQFFTSYGIKDEKAIREIYELIISDPANYLKYYVGYLEILDLKKASLKKKKEKFSQKKFHKSILDIGPAPFDVVEKWL